MEIKVSTRDVTQFEGDALAVGVFSEGGLEGPAVALDRALAGVISELQQSGEVRGTADEVTLLHTLGKIEPARVVILGLGSRSRLSVERIRRAAAIASRALRRAGAHDIGLALAWAESGLNLAQAARAQTEGALLGLYRFDRYKGGFEGGKHEPQPNPGGKIKSMTILGRGREPALRAAVERGKVLAESQNFARDLGNEPPNVLTPEAFAQAAQRMAQDVGLGCAIHGPDWMREHGMGALLGVAQGSAQEPRMIVLRYEGMPAGNGNGNAAASSAGLGLVGKGITFDTGGISIKPAAEMDQMKFDMCGGAAVVGAMRAIALLKPKINVTGLIPTTENMPGGKAYHPGDILRASNGKTVEILNTDAEGRLILADALAYATTLGLSPLIDAATLTGAIVVSLGHIRAGIFSNNRQFEERVLDAAQVAGERLWPMPMDSEYEDLIKSDIADMKQTGGRAGGSIAAAKVLANFVDRTPWAHLDIAGTAWRERRDAELDKGATGFGVRIFAELAMELAERRA